MESATSILAVTTEWLSLLRGKHSPGASNARGQLRSSQAWQMILPLLELCSNLLPFDIAKSWMVLCCVCCTVAYNESWMDAAPHLCWVQSQDPINPASKAE
jgi:hypothetical protein